MRDFRTIRRLWVLLLFAAGCVGTPTQLSSVNSIDDVRINGVVPILTEVNVLALTTPNVATGAWERVHHIDKNAVNPLPEPLNTAFKELLMGGVGGVDLALYDKHIAIPSQYWFPADSWGRPGEVFATLRFHWSPNDYYPMAFRPTAMTVASPPSLDVECLQTEPLYVARHQACGHNLPGYDHDEVVIFAPAP